MIESFARGEDIFRKAAATLFAKCEEDVTDDERKILRFLFLSFVRDTSMYDTRAVVVDAMVEGMTSEFPEVRFEGEARICQSLAE